ncbi:MDR family MFS transporter [Bacillus capparidis]|uniref:MFS family permease n=1 Tax=Bacillus capparidis TaxID=1840411 RepID=A0ABS4CXY7_9BACI|nr:MFS transporter [Bacillus capparidis]MBP1082236.1 MFS family permease [Bacillus capparidis]MED1096847.1 MFS transporter [Bacillus capparidis]
MQWLSWDLNLKTRLIGETIFNLMYWMYFPFIALYFSDALGKTTAGILMTLPPLMNIIGSMLGGFLSDRFGRRPSMLMGSLLRVVMFVLFAMSTSHWIDYLAFIGISLGGSIYKPASSAMVADLITEKDRRRVFATFVTGMNIGAVFGPVLGAIFFFHYRSGLLWTCTIVSLLYSIAIFVLIQETLPNSIKKDEKSNTMISVLKDQWKNYAVIFQDKVFSLYILAGVFVTVAFMQLDLYLAVYVNDYVPAQTMFTWNDWSLSLSSAEVFGWMLGLNGLMFVLCVIPITKWFENWSDRNTMILSTLLFGSGMFLIGLTTNVWLLLGFMVILTLGEVISSPVGHSFVSKYAPENARGQYMGASDLQYSVGRFIAPLSIVLSAWLPPIGVFGFLLLCTLIGAALYVRLFQIMPISDQEKKEDGVS